MAHHGRKLDAGRRRQPAGHGPRRWWRGGRGGWRAALVPGEVRGPSENGEPSANGSTERQELPASSAPAAHTVQKRNVATWTCPRGHVVTFDWISQHAKKLSLDVGKILSNVAQYRTCKGIWSSEGVWESAKHLDPSTWWEGLCFNEPLNPIAGQILQIPPSSAACERNWSEFGNVHTKLRNRLSGDRVQKLVYVHSNLNVRKASSASQQRIDVASGTESDTD